MTSGSSRPRNGPCRAGATVSSLTTTPFRGARVVLSAAGMVTRFSASEKVVLRGAVQLVKEADMKFTITHPMHSHPYNPELVTGSGIAALAAAAEAAGFDG